MAFVLAAVAGAGALVAGWWRWRSGQEEGEGEGGGAAADGPVSDDAYWGFDGAGEEAFDEAGRRRRAGLQPPPVTLLIISKFMRKSTGFVPVFGLVNKSESWSRSPFFTGRSAVRP